MADIANLRVKAAGGLDEAPESFLESMLATAGAIVDSVSPCMIGKGLSDAIIDEITIYLALHYISQHPIGRQALSAKTRERFEGWEVNYAEASSAASSLNSLDRSTYGQIAKSLAQGCLSVTEERSFKRARATFL